jgi:hypothetical protein
MFALLNTATNQVDYIVNSTDGYDLTGYTVMDAPDNPGDFVWNGSQFVARPLTMPELDAADLDADTRWQAMLTATPAQIETWLGNNVTSLADARRVLKFLIVALRRLHTRG